MGGDIGLVRYSISIIRFVILDEISKKHLEIIRFLNYNAKYNLLLGR